MGFWVEREDSQEVRTDRGVGQVGDIIVTEGVKSVAEQGGRGEEDHGSNERARCNKKEVQLEGAALPVAQQ